MRPEWLNRVALIGAGKSAEHFIKWSECTFADIYTSEGTGEFAGRQIRSISELGIHQYQYIIIASQFVKEIALTLLKHGHKIDNIYWFDFLLEKVAPLSEMSFSAGEDEDSLYAIYDLETYPPNFEIAVFLARAELQRKILRLNSLTLIIKAGSFGGVSARGNLSHGTDGADWRIQHILIPMGQLLPTCNQVLYLNDTNLIKTITAGQKTYPSGNVRRPQAEDFALGPLVKGSENGFEVRPFCASQMGQNFVKQFLLSHDFSKPFITISLREYDYQKTRNSCLDLYQSIAKKAYEKSIPVVVIRDTNVAMAAPLGWEGTVECSAASFDIGIRMAFYQSAVLNVSVSSGPSCGLMLLSEHVDFLLTHIVDNNQRNSSEAFLASTQGLLKGAQYPFSGAYQKITWSTNNDEIIREFTDMLNGKLEGTNE